MKILQINSVCGYGSTGRIAIDLYNILEEQGHECLIAYGRGTAPKGINSIKIGTNFDNYVHVAKTRLLDKHGSASTKATKEFIKKAIEYNPDVIHLHNIHGYYINVELLFNYLKEANKPVIWTLHDCWAFTGHCAYFDYVGCDKWITGCNKCPEKTSYPRSLLDNSKNNYKNKENIFTNLNTLTIVTPSRWLAELVKKSYLRKYPVEVINNGIDLDQFTPTCSNFREKYELEDKLIILGIASNWERRKGFQYFIDLSKKLKSDEIIILVGLSEKQKSELPKNIIGITKTNNITELTKIYSAADVFLNPTLEDNFPTTNLEALACGTPVITFDTGGSPEAIDNKCGLIIKKGDLNGMINAINEIKQRGKSRYSVDCRQRSTELFEGKKNFERYVKLYLIKSMKNI